MLTEKQLLEIPFDQYQRYGAVAGCVGALKSRLNRGRVSVLDVGGYPGLIKSFLDEDITIVDQVDAEMDGYVKSDGGNLPFDDESFDIVCSSDVMEHVPAEHRAAVIGEMLRTAKEMVIIVAPFKSDLSEHFQEILSDYIMAASGTVNRFLQEHIDNGLPDAGELKQILDNAGFKYAEFPNGYVYNWIIMMMIRAHFESMSGTEDLMKKIDAFYNEKYSPGDDRGPAFRTCFVISKTGDRELLKSITDAHLVAAPESETRQKAELFTAITEMIKADAENNAPMLSAKLTDAEALNAAYAAQLEELNRVVANREERISNLEEWIAQIHDRVPYKVYSGIKNLGKGKAKTDGAK
jgi:hypothetical protein